MENQKEYFTVKLDVMVPAELSFRVYAEDAAEAKEMAEKLNNLSLMNRQPKLQLARAQKRNIKVYKYGTLNLLLTKQY